MKSGISKLGLAVVIIGMLLPRCEAQIAFQLYRSGSTLTSATLNPGGLLTLDVVAVSITGNLDSFTYRISFPNEQFTLTANAFAAPFDNTLAPGGNNGSVPWSPLPLAITDNADFGSPGYTAFVPDIYRTTATTTGAGVTGNNFILETLTVRIPSPISPTTYPISLNVLEAADNTGNLVSTSSGVDFMLTVVPEPATTAIFVASLAVYAIVRGRRNHGQRRPE
jgi:hypothetical protein